MDKTFTNTDAIICWVFAVAEFVGFIVYCCIAFSRLRKRIVSMGRLIPTVPVIIVGGGVPTNQVVQVIRPGPSYQQSSTQMYPQQPPPPGFHQPQDFPPPYSSEPPTQPQKQ